MLWWNSSLATGIASIDNQHKSIFDKAEEVLDFNEKTKSKDIEETFKFLVKYAISHFEEEEGLMDKSDYPKILKHKEQHRYFMNELLKISGNIKDKGIQERNIDEIKILVIEWLGNHINEDDRDFIDFYNQTK